MTMITATNPADYSNTGFLVFQAGGQLPPPSLGFSQDSLNNPQG